ncbi:hypothetical protein P154DRAFT_615745 [Amniculicola lignicola CBS 123094]|uniref:Uncharacterized protein n=1 Tax=Amniculicola lignicola CBS 123094 TaxID=1392246 RepID=A0A6A5WYD9_9PLEO|nr:hypothetical protein P154DRAFT_615745 [Amniculicola lignicola CBS 123094]
MESSPPLPKPKPTSSLSSHPPQAYASSPRAPPSPPTQTLILSHPSARLSSSPASSPRIIESPVTRTRSLRPEMSAYMDQGVSPGADFFDDASSECSISDQGQEEEDEWGTIDENATQNFSEVEGLRDGYGAEFPYSDDEPESGEDNKRIGDGSEHLNARAPYNQIPLHDSGTVTVTGNNSEIWELSSPTDRLPPRKARPVSLRRLGRGARIVHHHTGSTGTGTPKIGAQSEFGETGNRRSGSASDVGALKAFPAAIEEGGIRTRHRRSTSESLKADSIINAHAITMRALESISPSASLSLMHTNLRAQAEATAQMEAKEDVVSPPLPTSTSFGGSRRIVMAPIETQDTDRPEGLPAHFIKTPYPFSAKKEFPRPSARPRASSNKGKQVLGIVQSDGEVDFRARGRRNDNGGSKERRVRSLGTHKRKWPSGSVGRSETLSGSGESVVLVSLRKNSGRRGVVSQLASFEIPKNLAMTSPMKATGKRGIGSQKNDEQGNGGEEGGVKIDFDDRVFAEMLRGAYRRLAGSWFWRTFRARRLKYIRLERVPFASGGWNGDRCRCERSSRAGLLAAGNGLGDGSRSPFTEEKLMELYKKPASGQARYTWVHWARRLAASDEASGPGASLNTCSGRKNENEGDEVLEKEEEAQTGLSAPACNAPDYVTTIQFVHRLSVLRFALASGLMLALSIVAALLWIFLGVSGWKNLDYQGRGERVTAGCLIGLLLLALEMVVFWIWIVSS